MKTQNNNADALEMIKAQANAIMSEQENQKWIDSPEKLLIATVYRLVKDGHLKEKQPAPITADILTKNGFEPAPHENSHYYFDNEFVAVDIHEMTDSVWVVEAQDYEVAMPTQRAIVCNVKELQQALTLFRIDKKIKH